MNYQSVETYLLNIMILHLQTGIHTNIAMVYTMFLNIYHATTTMVFFKVSYNANYYVYIIWYHYISILIPSMYHYSIFWAITFCANTMVQPLFFSKEKRLPDWGQKNLGKQQTAVQRKNIWLTRNILQNVCCGETCYIIKPVSIFTTKTIMRLKYL